MAAYTDEAQEAVFLCRMLEREPSLNRFFKAAGRMIAVRDGEMAPDDGSTGPDTQEWVGGMPLSGIACKVVRDAAFARRMVGAFLAEVEEHARQIMWEKEGVTNARP